MHFIFKNQKFNYFGLLLLSLLTWLFLASTSANAQLIPGGRSDATEQTDAEKPSDEYGRLTPRGTLTGYISAMAEESYSKAAEYLDLSYLDASQVKELGPQIVKRLQVLLDNHGNVELESLISDKLGGSKDDHLDPNLEKIGSIKWHEASIPVLLSKTTNEQGDSIWLLSAQTLRQLPEDAEQENGLNPTKYLPDSLKDKKWAGASYANWLLMIALIPVSYLLAWTMTSILTFIVRKAWKRSSKESNSRLIDAFALPVRLYLAVWILIIAAQKIGVPIIVRQYFSRATVIVAWVAILIFLWRLIDVFSGLGEKKMKKNSNMGGLSAMLFFRRTIKFILIAVGVITILKTIGIDVTAGLAALGIGGLAIALGAQKTVENLVGSLTVIFDQPVRVGDFCQVGDILGTVESVGMRSTRIRTLNRTLVTIPNGDFSAQRIENFTHRDRYLFRPTIGLRYETTPDQMRSILIEFRTMLLSHPYVNLEPCRVRFINFGNSSLDVEIFAYIDASDPHEFLEISEDLNLRIIDIVNASGSGFAFPSQTLYMAKDTGNSEEKTAAAEAKIKEQKDKGEMQWPKFQSAYVNQVRSSIMYPPKGSAAAKNREY